MGDWQTFQGHRVRITEDLVLVEPCGHMSSAQILWLLDEVVLPVISAHGLAYVLLDARQGTPADADSRRLINRWVVAHPGQTVFAAFGASRMAAAIGTLLINALRLLTGRRMQLRMFEEESTAKSWLLAQRERHQAGLPFDL